MDIQKLETPEGREELAKEFIAKYPWLNAYHNAYKYYVGDVEEEHRKQFDGECVLFNMPIGWIKAFGIDMCEEIRKSLEKSNIPPEDYKICQIKLKWGYLIWYDEGGTKETYDIIKKYQDFSTKVDSKTGEVKK